MESKTYPVLMGVGTVTVAALIVVKMLALNWASSKLQRRLGLTPSDAA